MNRKIYHVVAAGDAWSVRRDRARRADSWHENKANAVARAKALARGSSAPGQVIVHGKNGRIQGEWTFARRIRCLPPVWKMNAT